MVWVYEYLLLVWLNLVLINSVATMFVFVMHGWMLLFLLLLLSVFDLGG